jgi:hypothetical protein
MSSAVNRRTKAAVVALAALAALSGCSLDTFKRPDKPAASAVPSPTPTPTFDSQFTKDGTFQSHVDIDGVDFVYTLYPTKSTPRTNEWYPKGNKYFSFTFQAYDLDQELRDPFKTKRRVFLDRIEVESATVAKSGTVESPYALDSKASRITFDPEPQMSKKYGMLITSPKGAFELRNQPIGEMAADTSGLNLTFRASVYIQRSAGSASYSRETIKQTVPIAIFASDTPTIAAEIPINAN